MRRGHLVEGLRLIFPEFAYFAEEAGNALGFSGDVSVTAAQRGRRDNFCTLSGNNLSPGPGRNCRV
eukprot:6194837-Pleurochrysis_carterae.AAC.3